MKRWTTRSASSPSTALCLHQDLWKGARECPGCHRLPGGATTGALTLNTNLPTNTVMMGSQVAFGIQAITSGTCAVDIANVYLEDFDG